jgi:hypothetical protein
MKSLCVVHYLAQDYKVEQSVNNFQALAQGKHEWKESNTTGVFTDGHDAFAKNLFAHTAHETIDAIVPP